LDSLQLKAGKLVGLFKALYPRIGRRWEMSMEKLKRELQVWNPPAAVKSCQRERKKKGYAAAAATNSTSPSSGGRC
jgi:hypothetical protein